MYKIDNNRSRLCKRRISRAFTVLFLLIASNNRLAAQACTLLNVYNHTGKQVSRTNSASGSCTLPSGVTMTWSHVGAHRENMSFGCSSYDPTFWMDAGTMTVTFSSPVNNIGFLIWGLDAYDAATVSVNQGTLTLTKDFVDLCPSVTSGTPPTVSGNKINGGGGPYYGQIGAIAKSTTPFTTLSLAITGGSGFGLVGIYADNLACVAGSTAPTLSGTSITNTCPVTTANLNSLHNGTIPSGASLVWFTNNAHTGTAYATPTTAGAGTYYAFYYDSINSCYSPATSAVSVIATDCSACYKPAATGGTVLDTKHGITALGRAGNDNTDKWPMVRKGAWTALESKEKGFVINRVATTAALSNITNPVEGMMVYDQQANCLKVFTTKEGTSTPAWYCMITPACPD